LAHGEMKTRSVLRLAFAHAVEEDVKGPSSFGADEGVA